MKTGFTPLGALPAMRSFTNVNVRGSVSIVRDTYLSPEGWAAGFVLKDMESSVKREVYLLAAEKKHLPDVKLLQIIELDTTTWNQNEMTRIVADCREGASWKIYELEGYEM